MFRAFRSCILLLLSATQLSACAQDDHYEKTQTFKQMSNAQSNPGAHKTEIATFGAGCFWCTEAQFLQLKGVEKVESGYSGGQVSSPTYRQVCTGTTGHAEVCNVYYDPSIVSFDELLAAFWTSHDPTQLNRQGNDVGTQYRSVVFYHSEEQKQKAEEYKQKLNAEHAWSKPVVTEISPFTKFYKAEDYHQDYYNMNGSEPYCQFVVKPKVDKFKKVFAGKLKS
ncbi:MAG: peptide-methionine (S)-S-oxide reductase MsrA [Taibaiella sp.]|nr:peptide-methionine (S)-S-oxide reductase MsrA [Taibaiella sp.]